MKNRRIVTILVLILICLFININVFAIPEEVITVNGEAGVEITAYGEYTGAIYDSATKTLTLDNYSGDYIVLDFPDGDTINIVLKGTNNIFHAGGYTGGDINGLGVLSSNENELNINITGEIGSKLNISGYNVGIYVKDGNISIKNANIDFGDIQDGLIYTMNGNEIKIINTNIVAESDYFYAISGDVAHITFDNSSLISNDTSDNGVFCVFAGSSFDIKDSKVQFYTISNFISFSDGNDILLENCNISVDFVDKFLIFDYEAGGDATFKDCTINLGEVFKFASDVIDISFEDNTIINAENIFEFIATSGNVLVKDSKIDINNSFCLISAYKIDIINSDVILHYGEGDETDPFTGAIMASLTNIENSNVDITDQYFAFFGVNLVIDNSNVHFKSTDGAAMVVYVVEDPSFTLNNAYLRESNYKKYSTEYDGTPILSYFSGKPKDFYTTTETANLLSMAASDLHFVAGTNPNPETFDISILYIIIGILSVIGISIAKFDLDLLKNK